MQRMQCGLTNDDCRILVLENSFTLSSPYDLTLSVHSLSAEYHLLKTGHMHRMKFFQHKRILLQTRNQI